MKFEQALQAMREGKKVTTNWHLPFFYYIKDEQMFQGWYDRPPTKVYNLGVPELLLNDNWVIVKIENNGTISKDEFETACFEKVKPETAYWEKCGYTHKGESFLIGATCSKCNNYKEFEGRKTENGYIDFDYTKIDAFCSVCGAEMSNSNQTEKKSHLEKAFEECADQLKQEAVKMVTETLKVPVKKRPYYAYNTDINGKEGKYKIVFETDDWSGYRQLEEYIRENFIDKRDTKKLINKIRLRAENSSLNDSHIITVLCDCIDEQHEQIEQLQKEVERLNEKMNYCNID